MANTAEEVVRKRRRVVLTQDGENTFRVKSWTNSAELSVGMIITRAKLNKWCRMPGVEVQVPGFTPEEDDGRQLDLFTKAEVKAIRTVIATP